MALKGLRVLSPPERLTGQTSPVIALMSVIFLISSSSHGEDIHCPKISDEFDPEGTVGTLYNTAPYITDSNIARLDHGSQNS